MTKVEGPPMAPAARRASDPGELWTIHDLIDFLPWRRSVVYELARQSGFPSALLLPGPRGTRRVWLAAEVRAWALASPRADADATAGRTGPDRPGARERPSR